ncbi:MAG: hypothetical protein E7348_00535 [Clostridiales bacterium]|nr:hypothetical protein [Clostridiales bacterium]
MKQENLHSGHRDRTIKKFLRSPSAFAEHEVLEALLFYAIPRVDTNPLAHKLINMFGSLDGVFSATHEQLVSVDGVGDKVASYLMLVGQVIIRSSQNSKKVVKLKNTFEVKNWLVDFFKGKNLESFVMIMLDDNYNLIAHCEFSDKSLSTVKAEIPEVVTAFNIHKPKFAIFSHNHPSSNVSPSEIDDFATKKLNVLCEINDVNVLDHIIVAGDDAYSYRQSGKLDHIKQTASLNTLFKEIK